MNHLNFSQILDKLGKTAVYCRLENRPTRYKFGTKNYGEVFKYINPADGDRWDVIVPGYDNLPINKKFKIISLQGVFLLENGNHKLIVDILSPYDKSSNFWKEVKNYAKNYKQHSKLRGKLIRLTN